MHRLDADHYLRSVLVGKFRCIVAGDERGPSASECIPVQRSCGQASSRGPKPRFLNIGIDTPIVAVRPTALMRKRSGERRCLAQQKNSGFFRQHGALSKIEILIRGLFIRDTPYQMARRIIFARNKGAFGSAEEKLFIDQWIAIDWKHKIHVDSWSGDIAHQQPSFDVGLPSRSFETGAPTILEFGSINDQEDIAWLRGATHGAYTAGGVHVGEVTDVLARVHQLGVLRDGQKGFYVEVLTGADARDQTNKSKREQTLTTIKEVWWLFPIGAVILWWWAF